MGININYPKSFENGYELKSTSCNKLESVTYKAKSLQLLDLFDGRQELLLEILFTF